MKNKALLLIFAAISLPYTIVLACGPNFPNRVLTSGDGALLNSPRANFFREIGRIAKKLKPKHKVVEEPEDWAKMNPDKSDFITELSKSELLEAMESAGFSRIQQASAANQFVSVRSNINKYKEQTEEWKGNSWRGIPEPEFKRPKVSQEIPLEFRHYLLGAIAYHAGDKEAAIRHWRTVLQLPKAQRQYRSIHAAFMIGRAELDNDSMGAKKWFDKVIELKNEGFQDNHGLASVAQGWQAHIYYHYNNDFDKAIEIYLQQNAGGAKSAVISIQMTLHKALGKEGRGLGSLVTNDWSRQATTAYILSSHGGPYSWRNESSRAKEWLNIIESKNMKSVEEADRLAWMAYIAGDFEATKKWLSLAKEDSDIVLWLSSKLLLREGKINEAATILANLVRNYPLRGEAIDKSDVLLSEYNRITLHGEYGTLKLTQGDFVKAFDVMLLAGHWSDACYIAERVLETEELKKYIDDQLPTRAEQLTDLKEAQYKDALVNSDVGSEGDYYKQYSKKTLISKIRYVLARRLVRDGRVKESKLYFPDEFQVDIRRYIETLESLSKNQLTGIGRGRILWKKACIERYRGMELMGTEMAPDWTVHGGNFDRYDLKRLRIERENFDDTINIPTEEEVSRVRSHKINNERRFHYKWVANDTASEAVGLMPDNADETARMLCAAGSWIKSKYPKEADVYYKALVNRCGGTALGMEADEKKWFPEIDNALELELAGVLKK